MAFGNKTIVDLSDGEDNELILKAPRGAGTFYPHVSMVRLKAISLQLLWGHAGDGTSLKVGVKGLASLDSDHDISVMGEPSNTTRVLQLSIRSEPNPETVTARSVTAEEARAACGAAYVAFNRADWTGGDGDRWWVDATVRPDVMGTLADGLRSGRISEVMLGLSLQNLYSDDPPYSPAIERSHLFLRPKRADKSIDVPEPAYGTLSISLAGPLVELGPDLSAPIVAPDDARPVDEPPPVQLPVTAKSIEDLARSVDALRTNVKWLGTLVVLALLTIAARK